MHLEIKVSPPASAWELRVLVRYDAKINEKQTLIDKNSVTGPSNTIMRLLIPVTLTDSTIVKCAFSSSAFV